MPAAVPDLRLPERSRAWRWWVCCLLLLATTVNYMDRMTLNQLSPTILAELNLNKIQYGRLESLFGLAFAFGALGFGFLVDRWNVFWVYPLAVIAWSAAGFCTGLAGGFTSMLVCRFLLGLAESANWPCALRTTQRILPPEDRPMGNGILQSGAALGAILLPLSLFVLFDEARPSTWRNAFFVVGVGGAFWVVLWWASVRRRDLALAHTDPVQAAARPGPPALAPAVFARRFAALVVLVITINMTWHYLRAWLPLFLREEHGYTQAQTNWFFMTYYLFTDIGCLLAGAAAMRLARVLPVNASRRLVFVACAALPLLCLLVPALPTGPLLLGTLLVVGFGALGVFPIYYSFTQDLTVRSQGKVTGTLGFCCWMGMFAWQEFIGQVVERTRSYTLTFVIAGLAPLVGFAALLLLWGPTPTPRPESAADGDVAAPPDERVTAGSPGQRWQKKPA